MHYYSPDYITKSSGNSPIVNMPPVTFSKMLKLSYDRFQPDKCSLIFIASRSRPAPSMPYLSHVCRNATPRPRSPPATRHSFCSALSIYLGFHIRLLLYNKKHTHPVFYHCLLPW